MEVISYAKSFGTVYQFDLMKKLESDVFSILYNSALLSFWMSAAKRYSRGGENVRETKPKNDSSKNFNNLIENV